MPIGISTYGTTFMMGMHPKAECRPWTALEVMKLAVSHGLSGVSLPIGLVTDCDAEDIRRYAIDHHLYITIDTAGYEVESLVAALDSAAVVGAAALRTVVGGAKIGGDRRPLAGKWASFLGDVHRGFSEAVRRAEQVQVPIAVENHQDLASEELLWLCETFASDYFGLTLDAANPLATAEEPSDFYRRVKRYVKNVHLKDYRVYLSAEGYRLVRCPLGQGVIDFPLLFKILSTAEDGVEDSQRREPSQGTPNELPNLPMSIELAALEARHIRALEPDFWPEYPVRSAAQFADVMRFVLHQGSQDASADWRTPFEQHASTEAIVAYEEMELEQSLNYLRPWL